jgi:hypothetical protein
VRQSAPISLYFSAGAAIVARFEDQYKNIFARTAFWSMLVAATQLAS